MNPSSFKADTPAQTDFKISLKSTSGNTVAFINLSDQFLRAVTGKGKKSVTFEDVSAINKGNVIAYLRGLDMSIEQLEEPAVVDVVAY